MEYQGFDTDSDNMVREGKIRDYGIETAQNHPAENVKHKCEYDWCEECKYREKFIKVGNEMVCENCYNIAMAEIDTRIGDEALEQQGEDQ